jgi:uncharacterized protein (DUF697 family)
MDTNQKLIEAAKTAIDVVKELDKVADGVLPQEIAGIVKLHSKLAVGSSFIPIPGVDVAASATSIWSMYVRINNRLGLKLSENVIKTIASGVGTNLASYVAVLGVGSALKFIPGVGSIGGALIMGGATYALTLASGYVYLKAFSLLKNKNGQSFNTDELKNAVNSVLNSNTSFIKDFIKEAKKDYKQK